MTNPFISIWIIIRNLFVKVDAKLWQFFALGAGLLYLIYLLCCIHQINEYEERYELREIGGKVINGTSSIVVNVNHGLLSNHERKGEVCISIDGVVDTINTKRYAEHRTISFKSWDRVNEHNFDFGYIPVDSLLRATIPDSIYYSLTNMYTLTAIGSFHTRYKPRRPQKLQETSYTFNNNELFYQVARNIKKERLHLFDYLTACQYPLVFGYAHTRDNIQKSISANIHGFHDFPNIFKPWDISQKKYKFSYTTRGAEGCRNEFMPLKRLEFNFLGPVELSAMHPEPDIVSFSGMVFTDPAKLRQIMDDGLAYYAKFPQLESLQSIRMFFLTTFISLFFTLLCTVIYRVIRNKVQKIIRKKQSLNNQME